eukprot:1309427-Lingulodinium_polyedra.AAC.1
MTVDLTLPLSPTLSCSDASEFGNGVCVTSGLTHGGRAALARLAALEHRPVRKAVGPGGVLAISLFDGI